MVTITYPIPYLLRAISGRWKKAEMIEVADEIHREVRDVEEYEAPVVFTCKKQWPYGQVPEQTEHPLTEVRIFEGRFYAPCMVMSKEVRSAKEPHPLTSADFNSFAQQEAFWLTPFEKPYDHQAKFHRNPNIHAERLRKYQAGKLPRFERLKVKRDENKTDGRAEAIATAEADLARLICVDGNLWRETRGEPVIRYMISARTVCIAIADNSGNIPRSDTIGEFRLTRLEDCLDHVRMIMTVGGHPEANIQVQFSDLEIADERPFTFDDEKDSLAGLGYRVLDAINYDNAFGDRPISDETRKRMTNLEHALKSGDEDDLERAASVLKELSADWPERIKRPADIETTIQRWHLRPTVVGRKH